ncbi:FCD domain-containing protein [Nakamurella sp. YIM 132087]|uniref:FCD domain-containing protein n=1 Tax=Nakamurella alba TaxID=2665158 RepID=A0A7K1FM01_9ACTN|nr:GntR family transcriptional regulator [Nakamurella alba]MTD13914.1 FCD domain-containing protein [Nakamurella alba]
MSAADSGTGGLDPVASVSRRDGAISTIRRAIVLGTLQPGEKLTENGLAASLNVSRPTMREAVAQLAQEGLLVQEPYRGLRVADLDVKAVADTATTRVALDTLAVQEILDDPTGRRLDRVRQAWKAYDRLPVDADPVAAHEAHIAFHREIWAASENSMLIRLWPVTEAHITIMLAYDQATRGDARRAHDVHHDMVSAILARDEARVADALRIHTLGSASDLISILERRAVAGQLPAGAQRSPTV